MASIKFLPTFGRQLHSGVPPYDRLMDQEDYARPWGKLFVEDRVLCLYLGQYNHVDPLLVPKIYGQLRELDGFDRVEVCIINIELMNERHRNGIGYEHRIRGFCDLVQLMWSWTLLPTTMIVPLCSKDTFLECMTDGVWEVDGRPHQVGDIALRLEHLIAQAGDVEVPTTDENGDYLPRSEIEKSIKDKQLRLDALTLAQRLPVAKKPAR